MALKSTVFKAELQLADLDRNHFADYALTLAQHPSETEERLMVRLLAFALYAHEDLRFGKGLSADDEAALWEVDPTGLIRRWIEVGLPEEGRLRKACGRAEQVVVIAYGSRAESWWKQNAEALQRYRNLEVFVLSAADSDSLARLATRSMKLAWTIQEGTVYLDGAQIRPIRRFP
ncbi:YaeQ family protein [Rhodocyclus tenuis]|uniref:YaeQ family protein n=2 Tax=Rhodocyclus TaxID=1064 RepID=A0A6L5JV44_RHOTE|nr:hypothetical protein [Rhodocyclus gracilis]MRD73806.1 hypothetical protein [Rhodocyclus gracilis]NJA89918.1 YaeQ family protein [Rhodocyclus gracilis]